MSPGFKGRLPSAGRLAVIYIKYLYRMNQGTAGLPVGWVWSTRTHQVREASACRPSAPTLPETRMRRPSTPRDKDAAILFKRSTCATAISYSAAGETGGEGLRDLPKSCGWQASSQDATPEPADQAAGAPGRSTRSPAPSNAFGVPESLQDM